MRNRQWLQAAILIFLGLYLLDNLLTGTIYYYINERFSWLTWLGVGILLAMGAVQVLAIVRTPQPTAADLLAQKMAGVGHDDHRGHDHSGNGTLIAGAPSWFKLGIVGFPLIVGLIIPAKPLGASAIQTSGISNNFSNQSAANVLSISAADRNVLDWVRAFNTTGIDLSGFSGQKADVIGFVYRDLRFEEKSQFMVARFAVSCCVADASALGIVVETKDAAQWAADSWIHVKGQFTIKTIDNQQQPVLIAEAINTVEQPKQPYLYP